MNEDDKHKKRCPRCFSTDLKYYTTDPAYCRCLNCGREGFRLALVTSAGREALGKGE